MQVFIDTNIFLNFYHYTGDDRDVISQLLGLLRSGRISLHIPQQVEDEFMRNRESKLRATAMEFTKETFSEKIPRYMSEMEMAASYKQAIISVKRAKDALVAEATAKALTGTLEVDIALRSLIDAATKYAHDDLVLSKAKSRADRGNPPGKVGSYGDQYNWEMLLQNLPSRDLYIVSRDGDFASSLGSRDEHGMLRPNPFLKTEWSQLKENSSLYIFDSIKSALTYYTRVLAENAAPERPHVPAPPAEVVVDVVEEGAAERLADLDFDQVDEEVQQVFGEQEGALVVDEQAPVQLDDMQLEAKNAAIEDLVNSRNFANTHAAIARLVGFEPYFTVDDVSRIADAAHLNQQVGWIIGDADVNGFYLRLLQRHISELNPAQVEILIDMLDLLPDRVDENEVEF